MNTFLWSTGGFTAGCFVGAVAAKRIFVTKLENEEVALRVITSSTTRMLCDTENVLSNMTFFLGSPTASIPRIEYPLHAGIENYPDLDNNRSLMARYLTLDLYETLSNRRTASGFDIDSCIQTGVDNPDRMSCGIVAGDEECYDVFRDLFDPIITDRHRGFKKGEKQVKNLKAGDFKTSPFDPSVVKSTHFLIGRCIRGFRFPPSCNRAERKQIEGLLKIFLESLTGSFGGTYLRLCDLPSKERSRLPDILLSVSNRPSSDTLLSSGATRDWPSGRGVFHNKEETFFAWTNREDHLRVMYRDRKLDFTESFRQFCKAMAELEGAMSENGQEFVFHEDYGYLLTCPSGIGTSLRAGVHMKLPNLLQDQRFKTILKNLRLHMGAEDEDLLKKGYIDVYNMDRLGYDESHLVQHVADSVHILTEMEKRLSKKASISDLIVTKDVN